MTNCECPLSGKSYQILQSSKNACTNGCMINRMSDGDYKNELLKSTPVCEERKVDTSKSPKTNLAVICDVSISIFIND